MLTTLVTVKGKTGPVFTKQDFQSQQEASIKIHPSILISEKSQSLVQACVHHWIFPKYNVRSFSSSLFYETCKISKTKDLSQVLDNLYFYTNSGTNVFIDYMFYISIHFQVISRPVLEDCASVNCVVMHQTATLGENIPRSRPAPINIWLLPLEDRGQHKDSFWISPHQTPGSCPLNSFLLSSIRNILAYLNFDGRQLFQISHYQLLLFLLCVAW